MYIFSQNHNLKKVTIPLNEKSRVIFQPFSKIEGFSSTNLLNSNGGRNGP